jgi:hypothetical protein
MDLTSETTIVKIEFQFNSLSHLSYITTYYEFDDTQLQLFKLWFENVNDIDMITDFITKDSMSVEYVGSDSEKNVVRAFLSTFGNSFDLLENVSELDSLFASPFDDVIDKHEFDATDTINDVIEAHNKGDSRKVTKLLKHMDYEINDDVIATIRKKHA